MQSIVFVIILLVCLNFVLKQSYRRPAVVVVTSLVAALFVAFAWPMAIEQSRTQIRDWLANPALMLDTAVVLTVEVVVQMAYCLMAVHLMTSGRVRRRTVWLYRALRWFPGLLIFAVLFYIETQCMFRSSGIEFRYVAWTLAAIVAIAVPALTWAVRWLIPERELRLEVFFLSNALMAVLGIVATVNGRTAAAGTSDIDLKALAGVVVLVVVMGAIGYYRRKKTPIHIKTPNQTN